ncbi:MAG: ABC transporter permease subunit [Planctomycetes bacterium]|nr:ABC transporter permease subunit [Planctomycetota bacterium]
MLSALWSVARNTFTESIRQPVYAVLLLGTLALMALNPAITGYGFSEENKLLMDLGLGTLFLGGLLLAAFTATGVFSREIESQTVLTVVSKPVGRPTFVLGKFMGVAGALLVAYWVWAIAFLLAVRHTSVAFAADPYDWPVLVLGFGALFLALALAVAGNFFYGWVFNSALAALLPPLLAAAYLGVLCFGKNWETQAFGKDVDGQVLTALLLIFEALLVISAIALAASVRLGQAMTLLICAASFLLGLSSNYLFGQVAQTSFFWQVVYAAVPNLESLYLADALTQGHPVDANYVAWVGAYGALYVAGVLCLAAALFQTREVG